MADVFDKGMRSRIMSGVRSHGNKSTELRMIALFRSHGISGWRRYSRLFGNPDFLFPKLRVAMFVDGCFWHNCPQHKTRPSTNRLFWKTKLDRNQCRDRLVTRTLHTRGWKVVRVWQHELTRANRPRLISRIRRILTKQARVVGVRPGERTSLQNSG